MFEGNLLKRANETVKTIGLHSEMINERTEVVKPNKVTIITESGTILANGVLATTICGEYAVGDKSAFDILAQWKRDHQWLIE